MSLTDYSRYYKIKSDDIVLDIGAHIGEETVPWSTLVGEKGKIIAIEPNPVIFKILKEKTKNLKNVQCLEEGLFNQIGEHDFIVRSTSTSCGFVDMKTPRETRQILKKIKIETLDFLVDRLQLTTIDFLKADIEGAEIELLEGGKKACNMVKNICIAAEHTRNDELTVNDVVELLSKYNFKTFVNDVFVYGMR